MFNDIGAIHNAESYDIFGNREMLKMNAAKGGTDSIGQFLFREHTLGVSGILCKWDYIGQRSSKRMANWLRIKGQSQMSVVHFLVMSIVAW